MASIISVKNLVKKYRKSETLAVDDVSFEVLEGEFFTLLGPNGAGKTTIISILTTILSKTSGEVNISGFDIDKQSSQVRKNIGIIFQNPSLDLNLTAEENIRFHCSLYGLYPFNPFFAFMPKSYQNRVFELAEVLGIKNEIFKPIKTFSGGMKRKLEIIRSLMHRPKVLFLDEPTTGLDPLSRKNLWEYLLQVRKESNTTIFLTTHYLEEAEQSDNVCIINKGKIVVIGSPHKIKQELTKEYLIVNTSQKEKLRAELEKLKLNFYEEKNFYIQTGTLNFQKVIKSIKTPLSLIQTHNPTLEDAYLKIIEEKDD